MSTATDTCPGCSREFAPGGFSNHLRYSHDPRCISARVRLQSACLGTREQESPHPSFAIDVDMADLSDTGSSQLNQTGTTDVDMDYGDDSAHLQSIPEEAPPVVAYPLDAQTSVIFNSDTEDSDDDCDQDQMGPETPPSPRSAMGASTEQSKPAYATQVFWL